MRLLQARLQASGQKIQLVRRLQPGGETFQLVLEIDPDAASSATTSGFTFNATIIQAIV